METVRFDELDLCQEILRGVKEMGFEEASPIQAQAIPVAMQGYDVIGQVLVRQQPSVFLYWRRLT